MFWLSINRRKKEIRYVSVVTFLAVLFMTGIMLLQSIMNQFVLEESYQNYGEWTISSVEGRISHPYLSKEGKCETLTRLVKGSLYRYLPVYVGTVDEAFVQMANIRLYEGRMPERANEIVMDMPSLSAMGLSYDVGQDVTLYWNDVVNKDGKEETVLGEKKYHLVGVMYSFSAAWQVADRGELPGVLVMEEERERFPGMYTTWYYQLNPKYEDISVEEFYLGIKNNSEEPDNVVYNTYTHSSQLWGSRSAFQYVEAIIIVIGISSMGFLLASYTNKRRRYYYQYRCMGASIWQVRRIIFIECAYATVPASVLGMTVSYGMAFISCWFVAKQNQMSNFFSFDGMVFLKQVLSVTLMLLCSVVWTALQTRDKRLVQGNQKVSLKSLARLRKWAVKSKSPHKDFFQRNHRLHPYSRMLFVLFTTLGTGMLVLCFNQLNRNLTYSYAQYQEMIDFSLEAQDDFELDTFPEDDMESYMWGKESRLREGFEQRDLQELESIWGVHLKKMFLRDNLICLQWEEKEESAYIQYINENRRYFGNEFDYGYHGGFFDSKELLQQEMPVLAAESNIDWEAWEQGKEIILLWWDFGGVKDETIQKGETVAIGWMDGTGRIPVKVGTTYHAGSEEMARLLGEDYYYGMINVIASSHLADQLMDMYETSPEFDGKRKDVLANMILGQFSERSSFESTDKQLARVAKQNLYVLKTETEARRTLYQKIVQEVSIFGALFLLILTIFLVLQKSLADGQAHYRREQYQLLKKMGMEKSWYMKMAMKAAIRDYVWIFVGAVAGYILYGLFWMRQYKEQLTLDQEFEMYSHLIKEWTSDTKWMALDHILYQLNHSWTIGVVVVIFILLMGNRYLQTRNYIKKEDR